MNKHDRRRFEIRAALQTLIDVGSVVPSVKLRPVYVHFADKKPEH
jgi:hypothetical protein